MRWAIKIALALTLTPFSAIVVFLLTPVRLDSHALFRQVAPLLSSDFEALTTSLIKEYAKYDDTVAVFEVNKPCAAPCLSIFLLDGFKIRSAPNLPPAVLATRSNFVFVAPNSILVDTILFTHIIRSINSTTPVSIIRIAVASVSCAMAWTVA